MINPKEDAATIAESMFTGVSWKNLRSQMKQSPILTKKVQLLMREFERVSG